MLLFEGTHLFEGEDNYRCSVCRTDTNSPQHMHCSACGSVIREELGGEFVEVANVSTGAHSLQHYECFAADGGCCYTMA